MVFSLGLSGKGPTYIIKHHNLQMRNVRLRLVKPALFHATTPIDMLLVWIDVLSTTIKSLHMHGINIGKSMDIRGGNRARAPYISTERRADNPGSC